MTHSFGINIPDRINDKIDELRELDEAKGHFILDCVRQRFAAERAVQGSDVEVDEQLIEDAVSQYVHGQRTLAGHYDSDSEKEAES